MKMLALLCSTFLFIGAAHAQETLRCDIDQDGNIDKIDVNLVLAWRGQYVPPAPVEADVNGDGLITINDARACVLRCTLYRCEVL